MVCFDTDFLIAITRNDKAAISKLGEIKSYREEVYTTTINAAELFEGAYQSTNSSAITEIGELLRSLKIYDFTLRPSEIFGLLLVASKKRGYVINDMDGLIAAICIAHNETLITRDRDFEKIEGLKVEKW